MVSRSSRMAAGPVLTRRALGRATLQRQLLLERTSVPVEDAVLPLLMRTTIHTVTVEDALTLRPLLQHVLERTFTSTAWGQRLRGQDLGPALDHAQALVEEQPRTRRSWPR